MPDNQNNKRRKKDTIRFWIFFSLMLIISCVVVYYMPWIISLKDETVRENLISFIHSKGVLGVLMLLGLQIVQVVFAIIPGEPIEVLSGLLYGTFYGYLICTIGMLIGTVLIFYSVRMLGASFITNLIGRKKFKKYKFLHDNKRLELVTFILFFIPGTPKDLLTYFMPATKIKPSTFFIIVTVARIPSIISSTFAGASIGQGKWIQTVVIFVVIGAVGIIGIIFNEKFMNSFHSKREKIKFKIQEKRKEK